LSIKSFSETDGWKRDWTIVSLDQTVQKATWTRLSDSDQDPFYSAPSGADKPERGTTARFRFVAVPAAKTTYSLEMRETYANGDVIHWRGTEAHAFPASPAGTKLRPPIVLESSTTSGRPFGWIAAGIVAVVVLAAAAGLAVRARAASSPS